MQKLQRLQCASCDIIKTVFHNYNYFFLKLHFVTVRIRNMLIFLVENKFYEIQNQKFLCVQVSSILSFGKCSCIFKRCYNVTTFLVLSDFYRNGRFTVRWFLFIRIDERQKLPICILHMYVDNHLQGCNSLHLLFV